MEKISRLILCALIATAAGCSTRPILREEEGQFNDIRQEYNKFIKVVGDDPAPSPAPESTRPEPDSKDAKKTVAVVKPKRIVKPPPPKPKGAGVKVSDRRPEIDPFAPGESVQLLVSYLGMDAGIITMKVEPFKEVNGKVAYHFRMNVESKSTFSMIYSVSNWAETFMDYDQLIPITLTTDQNESSRLVESRMFFDWNKKTAHLWEKQVSKKRGEKKKELVWDILPYSQNQISALYYMRALPLAVGKKFEFPVTDDGKNYIFKGEVLRAEKISVDAGEFETLVVKPEFTLEGSLKPTGENLIWVTNDDRKFIVQIRAKLKIGSLYAEAVNIKK